jgi:Flp pilus assembly pilin Flp
MKKLFSKFFKEEEGSVIEYVLVLAVVAVIIAMMFPQLRNKVMGWFNNMINSTNAGLTGGSAKCDNNGNGTMGNVNTTTGACDND